jgi:hypothetical protein
MNIALVNSTRKWRGVKTWCIDTAAALKGLNTRSGIFGQDKILTTEQRQYKSRQVNFADFNPI